MIISVEEAEEVLDDYIDVRIGDEHRWYTDKYYTFAKDGKFYQFIYESPATENQEDGWTTNGEEEVQCWEVIPKTVEVVVYERV